MKQGDIGGLEALVFRYQAPALEAAYLITHDYGMAEDLVQSAFVCAFERIHQFDSQRPFGPWFLRGVVNSALTAVTAPHHLSLDLAASPASTDPLLTLIPSLEPGVEATIEAAETKEEILEALERLSPGQRSAVILHYYLDLTDREVAEYLSIPTGTVRRRLHDARKRLRRVLTMRPL
jgi:RNA polymerase sigma-70 factor (ECF subfamily)